jgi:hypothetical protein
LFNEFTRFIFWFIPLIWFIPGPGALIPCIIPLMGGPEDIWSMEPLDIDPLDAPPESTLHNRSSGRSSLSADNISKIRIVNAKIILVKFLKLMSPPLPNLQKLKC